MNIIKNISDPFIQNKIINYIDEYYKCIKNDILTELKKNSNTLKWFCELVPLHIVKNPRNFYEICILSERNLFKHQINEENKLYKRYVNDTKHGYIRYFTKSFFYDDWHYIFRMLDDNYNNKYSHSYNFQKEERYINF